MSSITANTILVFLAKHTLILKNCTQQWILRNTSRKYSNMKILLLRTFSKYGSPEEVGKAKPEPSQAPNI